MKLDAWLEQDHSLDERLRVIECLCQAVNEVHDQGEALGALEPGRIEVSPGSRCDLSAARNGSPSPAYAAPDREASVPTAAADVYAAGVLAWEILAGQSVGRPPRHLAEVRPDLPSELADAVMACLERSAEWRPKDLTYLAQMAAARQTDAGRTRDTPRAPLPTRHVSPRTSGRRPSRRTWPLLAALVVLLGIAAFQWRDYLGIGRDERTPPTTAAPPVTEPTPVTPTPASAPVTEQPTTPSTTAAATNEGSAGPATAAADAPPPASQPSESGPEAASVLPPEPLPPPAPVTPPARVAPSESAPETAAGGQSPSTEPEIRASLSAPAPTAEPAVLDAVSPLEVKRPGRVLLDLRGQRFLPRHRVRVLPVKKVPWGIRIVREKRVSETLITVLVDLSEEVEPGDYAFAVEDGLGARSDRVVFTVTK